MAGELIRRVRFVFTGDAAYLFKSYDEIKDKTQVTTDEVESRFTRMARRVGESMAAIGEEGAKMGVPMSGSLTTFGNHLEQTDKKSKTLASGLASLGRAISLGLGAGIAVYGYESIKAAAESTVSQAQLRSSLRDSHESWSADQKAIEKSRDSLIALGFTQDETDAALAQGIIATGSLAKARKELALASDLARYKGIGLSAAELVINRAEAGNLRGIKSLGLNLNVIAGGAANVAKAKQSVTLAEQHLQQTIELGNAQQQQDAATTAASYEKSVAAVAAARERLGAATTPSSQSSAAIALQQAETNLSISRSSTTGNYQETKSRITLFLAVQKVALAKQKLNEVDRSGVEISHALEARLHGQAAAYAKTLPGQVQVFRSELNRDEITTGTWLLPKVTDVAKWAGGVFNELEHNHVWQAAAGTLVGIPILAAVAEAANKHIIGPLKGIVGGTEKFFHSLASGNGLFGSLKSAFLGKNTQLDLNTRAVQENTDALLKWHFHGAGGGGNGLVGDVEHGAEGAATGGGGVAAWMERTKVGRYLNKVGDFAGDVGNIGEVASEAATIAGAIAILGPTLAILATQSSKLKPSHIGNLTNAGNIGLGGGDVDLSQKQLTELHVIAAALGGPKAYNKGIRILWDTKSEEPIVKLGKAFAPAIPALEAIGELRTHGIKGGITSTDILRFTASMNGTAAKIGGWTAQAGKGQNVHLKITPPNDPNTKAAAQALAELLQLLPASSTTNTLLQELVNLQSSSKKKPPIRSNP